MRVLQTIATPVIKMDVAFSFLCLQHRFNQQVAQVSKSISHSGDGHLYILAGVLAWCFDGVRGLSFLSSGLLAFSIELPVYWALKNGFKRRRPKEFSQYLPSFITPSDRYSLPSGHTAAAFLMATLFAHFYPAIGAFVFIWAGLIGLSRILLGVHFLTDVLIGAALGSVCAMWTLQLNL